MNATAKKLIGAAAGMTLLVPGATALAATPDAAVDASPSNDSLWTTVEPSGQTTEAADVTVRSVEGTFSYDQNVITPTNSISAVFQKAVSSLCHASFQTAVINAETAQICISCDNGKVVVATVDEMADEGGQTTIMGCACSGNIPGGGAIANAEVSGVSIASIAGKVMPSVA